MLDPDLCKEILSSLRVSLSGFCPVVSLVPSKADGYVQISWAGANKFCCLQELLLWSKGVQVNTAAGDQASHLCGSTLCTDASHVCAESAQKNNARKGCLVVVPCPHCPKPLLVCPHEPKCIKFIPGYKTWAEFLDSNEYH